MSSHPNFQFWGFVDRLRARYLALFGVFLTLGSAAGYWLSVGIQTAGKSDSSLWDALYFSVTTETTLGYGDIAPIGWGRLIACLQVICGLLIAGLGIAKITSVPGRAARTAARLAPGIWIERCKMPDGVVIVAISEIRPSSEGLAYRGANYDQHGETFGTFDGQLAACGDSYIEFHYKNSNGGQKYFMEGFVRLQFLANPATGLWNGYVATVRDFVQNQTIAFRGLRASSQEEKIIHSQDHAELGKLVRKLCSSIG